MPRPSSVPSPARRDADPRRVRRRARWHRVWGVCALAAGALVSAFAVTVFAGVPETAAVERAFLAAVPCPAAADDGVADCLRTVQATVTGTQIRRGRGSRYFVELLGPAPASGRLDMGSADPLVRSLRPGDRVEVTVWRDFAVAVARDGVAQEAADTPVNQPEFDTAVATAALAVGVYGCVAGGWALLRARRSALEGLPPLLVPLGKGVILSVACALPAALFGIWRGGPTAVVVGWLVLLPVALWLGFLFDRLMRRGRHRQVPAPPGP
ncbi:hypothetical protein [Peterkaempfera bronchialis]|uniref:hypothetical protein n=1 Tax=Peterkaempfera bronchialis TaxID=2126346 RepID=UPI003C2D050E